MFLSQKMYLLNRVLPRRRRCRPEDPWTAAETREAGRVARLKEDEDVESAGECLQNAEIDLSSF